eukprot:COSAG01_NODE_6547_length_3613_cov_6.407513_1_plen_609_part_00
MVVLMLQQLLLHDRSQVFAAVVGGPSAAAASGAASTGFAIPPMNSAVYLKCEDATRKGDWLSFSEMDLKYYLPSELSGRVPFLIVPNNSTNGNTFSLQNLWRGYSESRYGDFVSVDADKRLVLAPATGPNGGGAIPSLAAVFSAVQAGTDGMFYLKVGTGWVGPGKNGKPPSLGVQVVTTSARSVWSIVPAAGSQLPLAAPPFYFQAALGKFAGDWIGFEGTTVCCGACANTEDQRGVWGLVPLDGAASTQKEYNVVNLWHGPSERRFGDWLGVSAGRNVVLDAKDATSRTTWRLVAASPKDSHTNASAATSNAFYLQAKASGLYIGLTSKEAVTLLPKEFDKVAFSFVPVPPPPPPPPPPSHCNEPGYPQCTCPHVDSTAPSCIPPTPPPCRTTDGCDEKAFLGRDLKTQGSYTGIYGSLGRKFFGLDRTQHTLPSFVDAVTVSNGARERAWPPMATAMDPRALSDAGSKLYRSLGFVATAMPNSSDTAIEIKIRLRDQAQLYQLALYTVDFEGDGCSCIDPPTCCHSFQPNCSKPAPGGRIQSVALLNASTDTPVVPMQVLEKFSGGVYLRYNVRGDITIRIAQACAQRGDAMLNAIFFDDRSTTA